MTPPPYLADLLLVKSSHTVYASYPETETMQPLLFTTSKEPPGLIDAVTALPQLLQALETVPELPDDYHPHNPDAIEAFVDALRQWQEMQRAALTAAGYTFNA